MEPSSISSILDPVFSDYDKLVRDIKVLESIGGSDHNMVTFSIPSAHRTKAKPVKIPYFSKANFDDIRLEVSNID